MDIAEEAFQAALVFRACLMLGFLEGGVADEDLALFAPIAWLNTKTLSAYLTGGNERELTADFQYSAMVWWSC